MGTLPITNNNPFALIQTFGKANKWRGLINQLPSGFLVFDNAENGVRAGFINFFNTYLARGVNTIESIFPIYAPEKDKNKHEQYIQAVVKLTKIKRNEPITTAEQILAIGRAIIRVESGKDWIDNATLITGYQLAANQVELPKLTNKIVRLSIPFFF
jgi:hypothetical protein